MTHALRLTVTTPLQIVLQEEGVASVRAEDDSGDFGILPKHADFLTVIDAGVLRWRAVDGPWRYCALRGGIFTVTGGDAVNIACREAFLGADLAELQSHVATVRAEREEAARLARTQRTKLHARAIRHLMRQLSQGGNTYGLEPEDEL